jgi:hypothetical protein
MAATEKAIADGPQRKSNAGTGGTMFSLNISAKN